MRRGGGGNWQTIVCALFFWIPYSATAENVKHFIFFSKDFYSLTDQNRKPGSKDANGSLTPTEAAKSKMEDTVKSNQKEAKRSSDGSESPIPEEAGGPPQVHIQHESPLKTKLKGEQLKWMQKETRFMCAIIPYFIPP